MQYRKRKKDLGSESGDSEYFNSYTANEQPAPSDYEAPPETREDTLGNREGANMRTTFVPNSYQRQQQRASETGAFSTYSNRYLQQPQSAPPQPRYSDSRGNDNRGNEAPPRSNDNRGNEAPRSNDNRGNYQRDTRSYDNRGFDNRSNDNRGNYPRDTRSFDNRGGDSRGFRDNRGSDSRGYDNRGGDSRGFRDNRGGDSRGFRDNRGSDNRGYDNRGGDSRGFRDNRGGDSRGFDNRGGDSRSFDNRGGDSRGFDNRGGDSRGFRDNRGGDSRGFDNRGGDSRGFRDNRGGDSRGFDNRGGDSRGFRDNRGGDSRGFRDNRGGDSRGFRDNRGGDSRGFDNRGGDSRGFDNRGGDNRGFRDNRGGDNRGFRDNRGGGGRSGNPRDKRSFQVRGPGQHDRNKKKNEHIISLARALATLQFCSRNIAIEYIENARVRMNGTMVNDPNTRFATTHDRVMVDELQLTKQREASYILVHKTQRLFPSKEANKRSIHSVVPSSEQWHFPAGRMDKSMSGLVLMTNDPTHKNETLSLFTGIEKEYWVKVQRTPKAKELKAAEKALNTTKGEATISIHKENKRSAWITVTIKVSTPTMIRKALKAQGLEVLGMHRYRIGSLTSDLLTPGSWKALNEYEIALVRMDENPTGSFFFGGAPIGTSDTQPNNDTATPAAHTAAE